MALHFFICEKCQHVDSKDASTFPFTRICTQCETGQWHGMFPYERYDPVKHKQVVTETTDVSFG